MSVLLEHSSKIDMAYQLDQTGNHDEPDDDPGNPNHRAIIKMIVNDVELRNSVESVRIRRAVPTENVLVQW